MTEFAAESTASRFDLDEYLEHWNEYLRLKDEAAKFEAYKKRFKELFGDSEEIYLNGILVHTNRQTGKFENTWLKNDNPAMHAAYTREKVVRVFDEEALKTHNPELWQQYRSRSMRAVKQ
jgi:hypothetical protein